MNASTAIQGSSSHGRSLLICPTQQQPEACADIAWDTAQNIFRPLRRRLDDRRDGATGLCRDRRYIVGEGGVFGDRLTARRIARHDPGRCAHRNSTGARKTFDASRKPVGQCATAARRAHRFDCASAPPRPANGCGDTLSHRLLVVLVRTPGELAVSRDRVLEILPVALTKHARAAGRSPCHHVAAALFDSGKSMG